MKNDINMCCDLRGWRTPPQLMNRRNLFTRPIPTLLHKDITRIGYGLKLCILNLDQTVCLLGFISRINNKSTTIHLHLARELLGEGHCQNSQVHNIHNDLHT